MMIYSIENEQLSVQVNTQGAELWSVKDKRDGRECLWQGEASVWELRAPVIFPYCGRLKDFKYKDEDGVWHTGQQNHGFARFKDHKLKEKTEDSVTLLLESDEERRWNNIRTGLSLKRATSWMGIRCIVSTG